MNDCPLCKFDEPKSYVITKAVTLPERVFVYRRGKRMLVKKTNSQVAMLRLPQDALDTIAAMLYK